MGETYMIRTFLSSTERSSTSLFSGRIRNSLSSCIQENSLQFLHHADSAYKKPIADLAHLPCRLLEFSEVHDVPVVTDWSSKAKGHCVIVSMQAFSVALESLNLMKEDLCIWKR